MKGIDKVVNNVAASVSAGIAKITSIPIPNKDAFVEESGQILKLLEGRANVNKGAATAFSGVLEKLQQQLLARLECLNLSTALNRWEGDTERFGKNGIETILKYAVDCESISKINAKLDELEKGGNIWTSDIVKLFGEKSKLLQDVPTVLSSSTKAASHFTTLLGRKITGPINELCLKKSSNPEVIALEKKMQKLGYSVTFSDNLDTAKVITKAYETLAQKGIKMPDEIALFIPTEEGVLGFRPYTPKGKEFQTPILFNANLTKKASTPFFLESMGIKYNATDSPESVIYHEIGHFLHDFTALDVKQSIDIWNKYTNGGYDIDLAKEVGYYAMTGDKFNMGREFIAEVFAGLIDGKQYSKRVMDLYYKLGGPKIN